MRGEGCVLHDAVALGGLWGGWVDVRITCSLPFSAMEWLTRTAAWMVATESGCPPDVSAALCCCPDSQAGRSPADEAHHCCCRHHRMCLPSQHR